MTKIFTGQALAARIQGRSRARIVTLGRAPVCVTLIDPDSPPAQAYLARQQALSAEIGLTIRAEIWHAAAPLAQLQDLAADPEIDAVAMLHPLPGSLSAQTAAQAIGPAKEVDGQHPLHAGALLLGHAGARAPATAMAAYLCARELLGPLSGSEITLVGASGLIGRPVALLLSHAGATVTLCQAATRDLARHCQGADLIITAAGVPGLLGRREVAAGGRVLDLAICRQGDQLVGDADQSLLGHPALLSHVPDGVGPVTTACLLANITAAACGSDPDYGLPPSLIA